MLVLAAVPLLARITTTGRLIGAVAGTYAFIAMIDAIRITVDAPTGLGYLNLVAWLIPGMLGVAYRRHLLAGRAALLLGAVMLAVNLALMWLGPYELSLVGIETQQLKNMTPPSLLLAGHAIMMCAFAIAAAPAIARWARRPRVWWLTAIGNSGAMTLYLWHIPALLFMHLVFDYLGHPRYDAGAPGFIALSILQLIIMAVLVAGRSSRCARWRTTRFRCGTAGTWPRRVPAVRRSAPCCAWRALRRWLRSAGASRDRGCTA